jgi:exodeoxyribonuclease V alpha subunit
MSQHFPMLQRNLLYTGVTRGKRVVVVGQKKAVAIAVRTSPDADGGRNSTKWLRRGVAREPSITPAERRA